MALWTGFPAGTGNLTAEAESSSNGTDMITLKCRAHSTYFERKLRPRFQLNQEMLQPSSIDSQDDSILFAIPYEVLILIIQTISDSPTQVTLALTCKRLANAVSKVPLSLSATSRKYAGFLPVSVFDVPDLLTQLKPWAPQHLRLCNHCLTFRPTENAYWRKVEGCEISNFWVTKTGWWFGGGGWNKLVHNICPMCHGSCSLSDYVDCDGCRSLGRLGDVDWSRVGDSWRRRTEDELRAGSNSMREIGDDYIAYDGAGR